MKDQIKIAVITILIFVSGVLTGIWTQHSKTPPPPPFGNLPEFGGGPMGAPGECAPPERDFPGRDAKEGRRFMPPGDMEKMREKMEKLKPQMEEFKKKFDAIKDKSKDKIIAVLNAEQKAKFNDIQSKRDDMIKRFQKRGPHMGFGKGGMSPMVEHFEFLSTIIYKPLLERITQDLKLDDKQKKAVDEILVQRRKDVLELLDSTPPPSIDVWGKHHEGRPEMGCPPDAKDKFGPEARPECRGPQGPDDRRAPDGFRKHGGHKKIGDRRGPDIDKKDKEDGPKPPPPPAK